MKRFLPRRPTPALVVAVIALFVALGGSAYALTITGANITNGTVRGVDVKNYSLTGKDIKKESLGRVPIKEERLDALKLGKVKSAGNADGLAGAAARRFEPFTLDAGGTRELLRQGQLVLTARCTTEGANQLAEIVVATSANGAAVDGAQGDASLNVGETARLVGSQATPGTPSFDQESSAAAISADGTEIFGGDLYAGTSVLGQAGKCRFGGIALVG